MKRPLAAICAAPRAYLFLARPALRSFTSTSTTLNNNDNNNNSNHSSSSSSPPHPFAAFGSGPAPPRLPKEEQEIFEQLQRQSTGAFSTPRVNQSPDSFDAATTTTTTTTTDPQSLDKLSSASSSSGFNKDTYSNNSNNVIEARGRGDELHPDIVRGAQPEFEGDKNPKTGEIGGPKNEPLRWGPSGEWTYNGRTTDF